MRQLVSVVIPVYNGEDYVREAIESVQNQTHSEIEIIVVNDGSTDRSVEIIKSMNPDVLIDQENRGVAESRKTGIAKATGDYVAFIDQDDIWLADKLELQLIALSENHEAQYAICQQKIFLEKGMDKPKWAKDKWFTEPQEGKLPSAFIVRADFLENFDLVDTSLNMTSDIDMFFRLQDAGVPFVVIKKPLVLRRIHKMNHSSDTTTVKSEVLKTIRLAMLRRRNNTNE